MALLPPSSVENIFRLDEDMTWRCVLAGARVSLTLVNRGLFSFGKATFYSESNYEEQDLLRFSHGEHSTKVSKWQSRLTKIFCDTRRPSTTVSWVARKREQVVIMLQRSTWSVVFVSHIILGSALKILSHSLSATSLFPPQLLHVFGLSAPNIIYCPGERASASFRSWCYRV